MEAACESCGWAAAVCAMLLSGSFGVPIKGETARRLDIDPMVFQTYKTVVCFLVAATSLWLLDHPYRFTPWGIVSGLFWVPGGVGTVASVKLSGLAIAIAVGNSCIALVSFTWGIFVFKEAIHSRLVACGGVCMMILGFSGMSYYSTRSSGGTDSTTKEQAMASPRQPPPSKRQLPSRNNSGYSTGSLTTTGPESGDEVSSIDLIEEARIRDLKAKESLKSSNHADHQKQTQDQTHSHSSYDYNDTEDNSNSHDNDNDRNQDNDKASETTTNTPKQQHNNNGGLGGLRHRQAHHLQHHANEAHSSDMTMTPHSKSLYSSSSSDYIIPMTTTEAQQRFITIAPQSSSPEPTDVLLTVGDWTMSRRQAGIALAVFNGCWGGSVMVPMKFCPDHSITTGIGYVWSFSIGALIVNAGLWMFRYMWLLVDYKFSMPQAYRALPSFHLKEMWRPGGTSGLLWSIGNLFSILSVDYLGEGVGYCVVQASMLVSGIWGIVYFHEVKGASTIARWFLSAMVTVSGILLLSYEHHET